MLDYLWGLMLQGEHRRCLTLAHGELLGTADSLASLAKLNYIIFYCRMELGDPASAVGSGMLALTLARKVEDRELEARALVNLGWAHSRSRCYEEALRYFQAYLELADAKGVALYQRPSAWYGIAVTMSMLHRHEAAVGAFERLVDMVERKGCIVKLTKAKLALISAQLAAAKSDPARFLPGVDDLLREVRALLKQEHKELQELWGSYRVYLGQYYLLAKRFGRARAVAVHTLAAFSGDKLTEYGCHMILCGAFRHLERHTDALGHAVAARIAATEAKRYDLEFEAAEQVIEVLKVRGPSVVYELDRQYQDMGIDLGRFITVTSIPSKFM